MAILCGYNVAMGSINISSLKNQLSAVLQRVRKGEEVLVMDRDQPVARLLPVGHATGSGDDAAFLGDLQRRGIVIAAERPRPSRRWIESHMVVDAKASAVAALLAERDETV